MNSTREALHPVVEDVSIDKLNLDLARRATADITDVVEALSLYVDNFDMLKPPVLQMIQQRIHDLSCGIYELLGDDSRLAGEIREEIYPSERVGSTEGGAA